MNCPQEECEGCPRLFECEKPQALDYVQELRGERLEKPVSVGELRELREMVTALAESLAEMRAEWEHVISAIVRAANGIE